MNLISSGCYIVDEDYNVVNINETAKKLYPSLEIGKKCYKCLMNLDSPCGPCPVASNRKGPASYTDPIRGITEIVDAVDIDIEGHGSCHALIFSTVDEREKYASTLPASEDELADLAVIGALTHDYEDVFSVNIATDTVTLFRRNNRAISSGEPARSNIRYQEGLSDYCNRYVYQDDRETFINNNSIRTILSELKDKEAIINRYRVLLNNEIHYYFRKITRIGDNNPIENIVIGVGCEDERIRAENKYLKMKRMLADVETDSLTGLFTKEAFIKNAQTVIGDNENLEYDYCVCRVSNLGLINHQYGTAMGDRILKHIGSILLTYSTPDNCLGYLGKGEFASFTPNYSREERIEDIMNFREKIMKDCEIQEVSLKWSVYTTVQRNLDVEEIMDKAEYALSVVRRNVNQDYIEFDQSVIDRMEWEISVEQQFETAIKNREFVAYYQPKYSVRTGKIEGAEALVRWIRPDGQMVSPVDFIPVLEKNGKINILDEYIFEEVCRFKKTMKKNGYKDIPISVNLSRASLFKTDIPGLYSEIAERYNVDKSLIPIEITESAAVRANSIHSFADDIIKAGFTLQMDDFGSGYSSLVSLQTLPFSCIKLDRLLIRNIGNDDGERLLKHTVAFVRECGKQVVAEGVETYEQLIFLKAIGCDSVQGYYFSKPIPEKDFMAYLK